MTYVQIIPRSMALAVQRQKQLFFGNEGDFEQFSIFTKNIPKTRFSNNYFSQSI
ncbi:spore germination protein GerPE [Anaerobacillus sp. HL2]|nr:spore germination protein GerPE [Anaerobacillus sp. HL2]